MPVAHHSQEVQRRTRVLDRSKKGGDDCQDINDARQAEDVDDPAIDKGEKVDKCLLKSH